MTTLQLSFDDNLVTALSMATRKLGWTQAEFISKSLWSSIDRLDIMLKEKKHQLGYQNQPVESGEFDVWEDEQAWGDA